MKPVLLLPLALLAGGAIAQQNASASQQPALTLTDAYVVQPIPGTKNTVLYGTLTNHSAHTIRLAAAQTDASRASEWHEQSYDSQQIMRMRPLKDPAIAGHSSLISQGPTHLMLIGLTHKLKTGDTVTLTLTDSAGQTYTYNVPVKPRNQDSAGHDQHQHPAAGSAPEPQDIHHHITEQHEHDHAPQ